jgi:hypothetical protein
MAELTNANSTFYPPIPGALVATSLGLYYNFQTPTGISGFATTYVGDLSRAPELVFSENYLAWAVGTTWIQFYLGQPGPLFPTTNLIATPISGVPEPTTWAMLLIGFALLGGWRWRLRHSVQKS